MRRAVPTLLAAALAAGCGAERATAPPVDRPFTEGSSADVAFPAAGVRFTAPSNWAFTRGAAPLVGAASSGSATVAVWRYPRAEPLPREAPELNAAADALLAAIRARDPTFRRRAVRRVRVDGAPGVQVVGDQRVNGRPRRVRSTHVYAKEAEYVVDTYAAPRDFALIDRFVFVPLVRSLKIDPPAGESG